MTNSIGENTSSAPQPGRGPLIWMIVSQVISLLTLIPWLMIAGLSFMAFDSGETAQAWAFVFIVLSYPLLPIGFSIAAWALWGFKKRRAALVLTTLPLAFVLLGGCIFGVFMLPNLIAL